MTANRNPCDSLQTLCRSTHFRSLPSRRWACQSSRSCRELNFNIKLYWNNGKIYMFFARIFSKEYSYG